SKRWDTPEHRPGDPRRTAGGKPYPPFHDLMALVDGDAAEAVAQVARQRWFTATGETLSPVQTNGDPWPPMLEPQFTDVAIGVACTAPEIDASGGVRDVEQLYLDMIAAARRYIYIENQFFTAARIADALAARLMEDDPPEIVLVTRLLSHGWLEEMTLHVLRVGLVRRLRNLDRRGRLHVYYPHVEGLAEGTCVDMHSKLMIVDDQWLRVGSANLSNRSMGIDSECDLLIEARGDPQVARQIRQVRDRLIAEHAGAEVAELSREIDRAGSISGGITRFNDPRRCLRPLADLHDWSDVVVSTAKLGDPEEPVSFDKLVDYFAPAPVKTPSALWRPVIAAAAAVAAMAALWRFTPVADVVTAEAVIGWAEQFSAFWWAPLIVILAYTPACFVMFPRPLITLAAAVAFGPWLGFGYAMTGILLAAAATYVVGRRMPDYEVRRYAGERFLRLSQVLRRHGLVAITVLRIIPVAPFAVEGVVAGALRLKLWHLLAGTFIGMLPGVMTATVFGDQLEAGLRDPGAINFWVIGLVVLLLLLAVATARWWFRKLERSALADLRRRPLTRPAPAH
ncbi:MAG TPA: VTT domain-containing protein, partial [Burkholderiaceae bacterium]|nr:VTT domain-containing protein [Burkholderiaceae bacterium]